MGMHMMMLYNVKNCAVLIFVYLIIILYSPSILSEFVANSYDLL
jgi:hypothetical protein